MKIAVTEKVGLEKPRYPQRWPIYMPKKAEK